MGSLFVQTEDQLYFSNNYTGAYKALCEHKGMLPILMLRGYNSRLYYVKKVSASSDDQIVMEVKARVQNYDWVLSYT